MRERSFLNSRWREKWTILSLGVNTSFLRRRGIQPLINQILDRFNASSLVSGERFVGEDIAEEERKEGRKSRLLGETFWDNIYYFITRSLSYWKLLLQGGEGRGGEKANLPYDTRYNQKNRKRSQKVGEE